MRWLSDDAVARLRDAAEQPDLSGTRYRLVCELGRGGMGVVYEVEDVELARSVALKVLTHDVDVDEAKTIAALEHPGIVPIHDVLTLPDGRVAYTMKLVRGTRLDAFTREEHPLAERLRLFVRICEPVAFAHARGVVHRDLKPENVMVGEFGAVLVMDWGVHAIAGTPGYMAPERARGESATARADVYALGAILRDLIANERVPRRLTAIVNKAMSANANDRYANAQELAADVLRHLDDAPVSAYRENIFERAARFLMRYRALVALIAAYLVMRAIVFFWFRL